MLTSESSKGHKGGNSGGLVSSISDAIEVKKLFRASASSTGWIRILLLHLRGIELLLLLFNLGIELEICHHLPGGTVLSTSFEVFEGSCL